jgi:hypothetical protein
MFLFARVTAEAISGVNGKIDQITVEVFAILAQIGWFRFPIPFNARAVRVDQLFVQPLRHYLLVIGRVWPVASCIRWCFCNCLQRERATHDKRENEWSSRFHGAHSVPSEFLVQPNASQVAGSALGHCHAAFLLSSVSLCIQA